MGRFPAGRFTAGRFALGSRHCGLCGEGHRRGEHERQRCRSGRVDGRRGERFGRFEWACCKQWSVGLKHRYGFGGNAFTGRCRRNSDRSGRQFCGRQFCGRQWRRNEPGWNVERRRFDRARRLRRRGRGERRWCCRFSWCCGLVAGRQCAGRRIGGRQSQSCTHAAGDRFLRGTRGA